MGWDERRRDGNAKEALTSDAKRPIAQGRIGADSPFVVLGWEPVASAPNPSVHGQRPGVWSRYLMVWIEVRSNTIASSPHDIKNFPKTISLSSNSPLPESSGKNLTDGATGNPGIPPSGDELSGLFRCALSTRRFDPLASQVSTYAAFG